MSQRNVIPENHPHQLFVEGNDDAHSIIRFGERHGLNWNQPPPTVLPHLKTCGSDAAVLAALSAGLKTWLRFGIVIDADGDPHGRWREIQREANKAGIVLPFPTGSQGVVIPGITPDRRFGVWMMPDNQVSGRLEDFLMQLIPEDDRVWPHAQNSATEAQSLGAAFKPIHLGKAQFRTWLAWQEEPGLPPGRAIHRKFLMHDSPLALNFLGWFRRLFVEP